MKYIPTFIGVLTLYSLTWHLPFFGFEYEDAFINSFIANQSNFLDYYNYFRTLGCDFYSNGNCLKYSSFSGHYGSYSLFLKIFNFLFNPKYYQLHIIANGSILFISLIYFQNIYTNKKNTWLILSSLFASLPFIYVFNSSLIETLSFSIGLLFFTTLYDNHKTPLNYKVIILITLTLILSLLKRENLIYYSFIPIYLNLINIKNFKIAFTFLLSIVLIVLLNPFYTEFIETAQLNKHTFSFDYLTKQLPVYLFSFFNIEGYITITCLLFLVKRHSKLSLYILLISILFLFLYSFHYRSQFIVNGEKMILFDTYRYMTNIIPLLIGVFIFSKTIRTNKYFINTFFIASVILFLYNQYVFNSFVNEECFNYHHVNKVIENHLNPNDEAIIYDDCPIISIMYFQKHKNIKIINSEMFSKIENKKIFVIKRYGQSFQEENYKKEKVGNNCNLYYN
ncbi:hypothetical protein JJL45_02620 [Tamlana sp. s12]|uniref:hypothetical protein n=1 Tax=Tamlana sp. s12 TaxID=1630406 RepID=UPI0007FB7662|nr:hypothetical protein [Tamlana sp. s12]OBQ56922.1 hypothetical protein VQ01_00050 [Tamlana sp. s12]QQY82905.1 hypothetical protein JJL45_02620 [Tamlana sp. s12]